MHYSKNLFFKVSVYCISAINFLNIVIDLLRARGQLNKTFTSVIYKWVWPLSWGDVTRDHSQRPVLTQQSATMLEQCCGHSKQHNVATMLQRCKSRRCESSLVTYLESENNSYTVWLVNYTCKSFIKLTPAHVPMVPRAYFVSPEMGFWYHTFMAKSFAKITELNIS